jgi:hypothetical protein
VIGCTGFNFSQKNYSQPPEQIANFLVESSKCEYGIKVFVVVLGGEACPKLQQKSSLSRYPELTLLKHFRQFA